MTRKILANLFAGLILFLIPLWTIYWPTILSGEYRYYNNYEEDLGSFLLILMKQTFYPYIALLFLLFALLPFQLVKDYYYKKKGKGLSLIKKIGVFQLILMLIVGVLCTFVVYLWKRPAYLNLVYILYLLPVSILFSVFLWATVDRYVEKADLRPEIG